MAVNGGTGVPDGGVDAQVARRLAVPAADDVIAPEQRAAVRHLDVGDGLMVAAGDRDQRLRQPPQRRPRAHRGPHVQPRPPRPGASRQRQRRRHAADLQPGALLDLDVQAQVVTAERPCRAAHEMHRDVRSGAGAPQQQRGLAT
jgi:hypothetical protein